MAILTSCQCRRFGTKRGFEPQNPSVVTCQYTSLFRYTFSPVLSSLLICKPVISLYAFHLPLRKPR